MIMDIWEYARKNIQLGCHVSALLRHDLHLPRHVFGACAQVGRVISDGFESANFADRPLYLDPVDGRPFRR